MIGVPSELSEDDVKAFVVAAPGAAVDAGRGCATSRAQHLARVQGAALHRGRRRAAAHADRPHGQAPAADRPHADEVDFDDAADGQAAGDGRRRRYLVADRHRLVRARPHHRRRPRPADRDHGAAHAHRARVPAHHPARRRRRAATHARRRARVARRSRAHAERAVGPPHLHRRARGDPGCGRGRAARRGQRVPRTGRRHRAVPRRRARATVPAAIVDDDTLRADRRRRGRAARAPLAHACPGLGHPVHKDGDPRTPRLYELAAQEGLLGPHLRLLELVAEASERGVGAGARRSTAPGRAAPRSSTSGCRRRRCGASC